VADSLLRGEGSPRSVRAAMRRTRSARHSIGERRSTMPVNDEENPLHFHSEGNISRQRTRDTMPNPSTAIRDIIEEEQDQGDRRTRLRALSETLSGMMGRKPSTRGKGKGSEDRPSRDGSHDASAP
jgi:hypothetical protein